MPGGQSRATVSGVSSASASRCRWSWKRRSCQPPQATRAERSAAADRSARVAWGGWQLRRFQDHLHLLADAELTPLTVARDWPPGTPPPDLGAWRLVAGPGDGSAEQPALQLPDGLPLRLAPARGGERLALNGCHQRIAELWRAAGVPPWRRRQWPLVYAGDDLVAVPGVPVADPWRDQPLTTWHLEPAS